MSGEREQEIRFWMGTLGGSPSTSQASENPAVAPDERGEQQGKRSKAGGQRKSARPRKRAGRIRILMEAPPRGGSRRKKQQTAKKRKERKKK